MDQSRRLELISKLEDQIHDCLGEHVSAEQPLALVDTPDIRNCGDAAIWLGTLAWMKRRFGKEPDYVTRRQGDFSAEDFRKAVPEGPILMQGGGSFGDIWKGKQDFREWLLESFPERKIIQMPQSIHYNSEERLEQSRRAIGKHRNFLLVVRDRESQAFAEKNFDCEVRLSPDMAFALGPLKAGPARFPVLAILRQDAEKADFGDWDYPEIPNEDWIHTEHPLKARMVKARASATGLLLETGARRYQRLLAGNRYHFDRGMAHLARGEVVITDRLHVHIFSLLIGRDHAVLDNNYRKIGRLMDTFYGEYKSLVHQATSYENAVSWARMATSSAPA